MALKISKFWLLNKWLIEHSRTKGDEKIINRHHFFVAHFTDS